MKTIARLVALILLFVSVNLAQGDPPNPDAAGRQEKVIAAYFAAFNSDNQNDMAEFFKANASAESLKQRPVEQRMQFFREVRSDAGKLTPGRLQRVSDYQISATSPVKGGDKLILNFIFEAKEGGKLDGIKVERKGGNEGPDGDAGASASSLTENEFIAETGKYLDETVKADAFSGVVLIAKGDKILFHTAYGSADKQKGTPNKLDTKFNLGSINKAFTQIAVGELILQGKISPDDKLGKFLPDYPNADAREKVTVRHLLNMTSGIGDFFGNKYNTTPKSKLRSINDFIPLFSGEPLAFEPGSRNQYSNGGYVLLGAIIEKVSGKSYYDYILENITAPLGMTDTQYLESEKKTANVAEGYTKHRVDGPDVAERVNNIGTRPARGTSAGGGYSTAPDMLKLSLALQSGRLKLPNRAPAAGGDGKFAGLGIAGGAPGINSAFEIEDGYTIIVMSNYDPPASEAVARRLRGLLARVKR